MKKSVSVLLVICIAAGLTASRGRADIPTQTTTATETTTIRETTPEETMPEETTVEETTVYVEETEPSATPEELNAYFQRIRSDAWVEICADPTYATHIRFTNDGGLQVDSKYECDGVCESYGATYQSSDRGYWENKIQYSNETSVMVCFIDDMDSEDLIHYDAEGNVSNHYVMIRESRLNHKTDLADRLRNTSWRSGWFAENGVDAVRIADFTVYPINETTAYLEYPSKVGSDNVRAVAVRTPDENTLNVYLITTYAEEGYCPETYFSTEQWTAVS